MSAEPETSKHRPRSIREINPDVAGGSIFDECTSVLFIRALRMRIPKEVLSVQTFRKPLIAANAIAAPIVSNENVPNVRQPGHLRVTQMGYDSTQNCNINGGLGHICCHPDIPTSAAEMVRSGGLQSRC
jgi:hypothetical protein